MKQIYDHLIRVHGGLGTGDLRQTSSGVFGSVPQRCPMFMRAGADPIISSHADGHGQKILSAQDFGITANFVALGYGGVSESEYEDVVVRGVCVYAHVGGEFCRMQTRVNGFSRSLTAHGFPRVVGTLEHPVELFVFTSDEACRFLNGVKRIDGKIVDGDPGMTRVVKVSCLATVADDGSAT